MLITTVATIPLLAMVPASYQRLQLDQSYQAEPQAINAADRSTEERAPLLRGGQINV